MTSLVLKRHSTNMPSFLTPFNKQDGRYMFQIDLSIALLNYDIQSEWKDTSKPMPDWMWQTKFEPYNC